MKDRTSGRPLYENTDWKFLELDELEALRTRVAEWLGWRKVAYSVEHRLIGTLPTSGLTKGIPSYCQSLEAAWEVVEFVAKRGYRVNVETIGTGTAYQVEIAKGGEVASRAAYRTPAGAICIAFDLVAELIVKK